MRKHFKPSFKFRWNYLGMYKPNRELTLEEMIEKVQKELKEKQQEIFKHRVRHKVAKFKIRG